MRVPVECIGGARFSLKATDVDFAGVKCFMRRIGICGEADSYGGLSSTGGATWLQGFQERLRRVRGSLGHEEAAG